MRNNHQGGALSKSGSCWELAANKSQKTKINIRCEIRRNLFFLAKKAQGVRFVWVKWLEISSLRPSNPTSNPVLGFDAGFDACILLSISFIGDV